MMTFISIVLLIPALLLAIPATVFFVEVIAAIVLPQRDSLNSSSRGGSRRPVAVLVPAYNESIGLLPTLANIKTQMNAADRLLVVADNCSDDTAAVAAAAGADVVVRNDPDRGGKGYALAWGLRHLGLNPPDIVIIIDADCRPAEGAIERLARTCEVTHRPVQALDLMISSLESPIESRVAEFTWRVKNWVRPLGLAALGLPCQLMGTGMAFPWDVIRSADLASGSTVEDLKLGVDLTLAGSSPVFCPSALVTSDFPSSLDGVQSQRLRWESGHIWMILTAAPRLLFVAITRGNFDLLALTLDLAVPPLSLLGFIAMVFSVIGCAATLLGFSSASMWISIASLVSLICSVLLCWSRYGHDLLPPTAMLSMPSYVIRKLPLYRKILSGGSGSEWIRTDRTKS